MSYFKCLRWDETNHTLGSFEYVDQISVNRCHGASSGRDFVLPASSIGGWIPPMVSELQSQAYRLRRSASLYPLSSLIFTLWCRHSSHLASVGRRGRRDRESRAVPSTTRAVPFQQYAEFVTQEAITSQLSLTRTHHFPWLQVVAQQVGNTSCLQIFC